MNSFFIWVFVWIKRFERHFSGAQKYTIEGPGFKAKLERPDVLPEPGQTLIVRKEFKSGGGKTYRPGDHLYLVERTQIAPELMSSSLGNWAVRDQYGEAIWTVVEYALFLRLVIPLVTTLKVSA